MTLRADLNTTRQFVAEYAAPGASILIVGGSDAGLAKQFIDASYEVTVIDTSAERVEALRRDAIAAEITHVLEYEPQTPFDIVLFYQSLHGLKPLDQIFVKVKNLLKERGRILVEDLAREAMDEKTAEWVFELEDFVMALQTSPTAQEEAASESETPDWKTRWQKQLENDPSLHSRKEMVRAMELKFGNVLSTAEPYLFRLIAPKLSSFPGARLAISQLIDWEKNEIGKGRIQAVGMRIAAKKYFSYLK